MCSILEHTAINEWVVRDRCFSFGSSRTYLFIIIEKKESHR